MVMKQAPTPQLLSDQKYFSTKQLTDLTWILPSTWSCIVPSHQVLYLCNLTSALRDGLRKGVAFKFRCSTSVLLLLGLLGNGGRSVFRESAPPHCPHVHIVHTPHAEAVSRASSTRRG